MVSASSRAFHISIGKTGAPVNNAIKHAEGAIGFGPFDRPGKRLLPTTGAAIKIFCAGRQSPRMATARIGLAVPLIRKGKPQKRKRPLPTS
jgi:hypothetical protein